MIFVSRSVQAIKENRSLGASQLAEQALQLVKESAERSKAATGYEFKLQLFSLCRDLASCRPTMAPIANLVSLFVCRFASAADNGTEPADIKKLARDSANRILADGQKARQAVCRHAAEIITSRSIILTCSYSSTICRALALAREKGLDFKVLAARSQLPEAGMAYGDITAAELDKWGIDCQVAAEEILTTQPPAVNLFLIGADAIMMDGSLTNGYPSLCLARAFQHRVPLYALAETSKINPQGLMAAEPGFDLIPAGLITGIISEQGIIPAAAIKTCGQQWKQYRDMAADILAGFMRV